MEATLRSRWVRRGIYAAVVAAVVVGLYAIAGFIVVPRVLRSELTSFVSTHYHRQLTLDDVRFNPFTLTLDTGAISFPDADASPMLGVAGLHVGLQLASLWRRGASFGEIILDRPFARIVIRKDDSVNLADLEKPFAQAPKPKPAVPSAPLRLFIDHFAAVQGHATYEDDSRPTPFSAQFVPVSFSRPLQNGRSGRGSIRARLRHNARRPLSGGWNVDAPATRLERYIRPFGTAGGDASRLSRQGTELRRAVGRDRAQR